MRHFKTAFLTVLMALIWIGSASATSTINPNNPAQNSALSSSVLRQNFLAAYNDINGLQALTVPFGTSNPGIVPQTGGVGSTYFLSAAGTWLVPAGSGGSGINQLTGDGTAGPGTGSQAFTLATVNANVGTFGSASSVPQITTNGKGLITGVASVTITPAAIGAPTTTGTGASGTWGIGITGNAATASALAALPAQCSGGQFATGIAASGAANCSTPSGSGNVSGPGSSTNLFVPQWNGTTGTLLSAGLGVGTTGNSVLLETDSGGHIVASVVPTLNQNTTGTAANITGVAAIANGGTGQATQQAALNALAGAATSGQYLRGNGTNVVLGAIQVSDVPTLNQSTTGNAATVTTNANLTGDITSVGNATTLTNAPVIAKVLTGFTAGAGTVSATDSILSAFQKVVGNINGLVTGVNTVFGRTGAVTAQSGDYSVGQVTGAAPLASPTFTGTVGLPANQAVNGVILNSAGSSSLFLNQAGGYTTPSGGGSPAGSTGQIQTNGGSGSFSALTSLLSGFCGTAFTDAQCASFFGFYDPRWYSSVGFDGQTLTNITTTSSSATISSGSYAFSSSDVGAYITLGAGSNNATTGSTSSGSYELTSLGSTTGIIPGDYVYGTGIPSGARVVSSQTSTLFMTGAATATGSGASLTFAHVVNTTISSVSAGNAVLATTLGTSVSGTAVATFGHDTHTAIQDAISAASSAGGGLVRLPVAMAVINTPFTSFPTKVSVTGEGAGASIIKLINTSDQTAGIFDGNASGGGNTSCTRTLANQQADNHFTNFEIDNAAVTLSTNQIQAKGLHITCSLRQMIDHMYIHDTAFTGIGGDYGYEQVITNNILENTGRLANQGPATIVKGANGIGIALVDAGGDSLIANNNTVINTAHYGIFVESEGSSTTASSVTMTGNVVIGGPNSFGNNDNAGGIANSGAQTAVITGNRVTAYPLATSVSSMFGRSIGISTDNGTVSSNSAGTGTVVSGNSITGPEEGIRITYSGFNPPSSGNYASTTVTGNRIEGATDGGISITPPSSGTTMDRLQITGNIVDGSGGCGVCSLSAGTIYNLSIQNNILSNNGQTASNFYQQAGIGFSAVTLSNATITGNTVFDDQTGTQKYGIAANSSVTGSVYIEGNNLKGNAIAPFDNQATLTGWIVNNGIDSTSTASGSFALFGQTGSSEHNVATGYQSLLALTTGSNNVAVGYQAGDTITTGTSNVIVGANSQVSSNTDTNEIVFGQGLTGGGSNTLNLGGVITASGDGTPSTSMVSIPGKFTVTGLLTASSAFVSTPSALTISTSTFTPVAIGSNTYRVVLVHASCPCTIANPSGTAVDGQRFVIEVWQSSTGSDAVGTWGTSYDFGKAGAPTLSTGANNGDILGFSYSSQNSKYNYLGIQQGM